MKSPPLVFPPRGLYSGGRWPSPAEGKPFVSIKPSTMEKLADVPAAGDADVDAAVKAAKVAFKEWSRVPIKERARCLELLALPDARPPRNRKQATRNNAAASRP